MAGVERAPQRDGGAAGTSGLRDEFARISRFCARTRSAAELLGKLGKALSDTGTRDPRDWGVATERGAGGGAARGAAPSGGNAVEDGCTVGVGAHADAPFAVRMRPCVALL